MNWRLMEKGEFNEEKLFLDEIREQNELIYGSYRNEYYLLLDNTNPEAHTFTKVEEKEIEDDLDVLSFINQSDIVTELNEVNESEKINNENLLLDSLITNQNLINKKEENIPSNKIDSSKKYYLFS